MLTQLVLATLVGLTIAKNTYVVIVPKDVRPGMMLNVSVNILHASQPVDVKADLIHKTTKMEVASNTGTFTQGAPGILTVHVPDDLASGAYQLLVLGSKGLDFANQTDLHYQSKSMSIFIQTDKATYKPGQTVNFRVFAMYPNMSIYTGSMDIEIHDPNGNKIKRFTGLQDASGVITNFMVMDSQPVLGDWKIIVTANSRSVEKTFTVARYVLPKFEVKVNIPSYGVVIDTSLSGSVRATYTYGKPVHGKIHLTLKMTDWMYIGVEPKTEQTLTTDGDTKFTLPLALLKSYRATDLTVEAEVTENLTNITLSDSARIKYYSHAEKVEFLASNPNTFKPGLNYTAYVKVSRQDDVPFTGARSPLSVSATMTCEVPQNYSVSTSACDLPVSKFTVPDTGIVPVKLFIPRNAAWLNLQATYGEVHASKFLQKSVSPSDSYVQLFVRSSSLKAGGVANFNVESTQPVDKLTYQIISRGTIVGAGSIAGANEKSFTFSIPVNEKMAPNARMIIYYVRADGEIVTDSISFDVGGAFQNHVSLKFDKSKAQPGENVNVQVTADPNSLVNLLAVDQSVLLLKSGNDITPEELAGMNVRRAIVTSRASASAISFECLQVINELKSYNTIKSFSNNIFGGGIFSPFGRRKRSFWWPYPTYFGGSDAQEIFLNSGVIVMTDAMVYYRPYNSSFAPYSATGTGSIVGVSSSFTAGTVATSGGGSPFGSNGPDPGSALQSVQKIRQVFPETWLWTNASTGANGQVSISVTVPDTITSWIASAFAVNTISGLGIAERTAKIEAFRPFFVTLNLPYSVVRGEQLALQATVFNYMSLDMDRELGIRGHPVDQNSTTLEVVEQVLVTLEKSDDFRSIVMVGGREQYVSFVQRQMVKVASGKAASVFFPIVPASLGNIDITVKAQSMMAADGVRRQLLVEPEGVPKEYNLPILVDLKQSNSFHETVSLTLPPGVVAGSEHVRITAIGDLMGPTVNGLDSLLRMPNGCGEQTMVNFAPDVFVTNYLTAIQQLSPTIEKKATDFMEKGYQGELTFQHKDGSFSAFGQRDISGSIWLTAFVAKSFHQAKIHIFIDDNTLIRAIDWIIARQNNDGSFVESGHVFGKAMQGGSASGPGLTAFVLISLLENNDLGGGIKQRIQGAITKATTFLESKIITTSDNYVLAIVSYALELAHSSQASTVFARLNQDVIVKNGMKHWHKASTKPDLHRGYWRSPQNQADPVDIELTSYALLVYAKLGDFTQGLPVMRWITSQRNPHGGFSSTQDTVIALQALSEFAKMAYANNFDITANIVLDAGANPSHQFKINAQNALVLQSYVPQYTPLTVTVAANGHGIGLVEVSAFFNVKQDIQQPSFNMTVTILAETLNILKVKTCANWLLPDSSSMAVQELGIPTGFVADLESIVKPKHMKKIETENRKVILYFDQISATPTCITIDAIRTGLVAKSKPTAVRVYDYYQPSNQVTKFYESRTLKSSSICDVCRRCACALKA